MDDDEARIREYEEKLQLESLKRKVSMMKFPAPDRKKSKFNFSKALSNFGGQTVKPEPPRTMPLQVKIKTSAKTIKLPTIVSETSISRIVEKPWKFATKNVDECPICSNHLFSVCHPHISSAAERNKSETLESYSCSICRENHDITSDEKRKIVMGASSLHNVWKETSYQPGFHIDFDCIIGGEIHMFIPLSLINMLVKRKPWILSLPVALIMFQPQNRLNLLFFNCNRSSRRSRNTITIVV